MSRDYFIYARQWGKMTGLNDVLTVIRLKDFQFSEDILILEPWKYDDKKFTLVIEKEQQYLVHASTKRVVKRCCSIFGTSLEVTTRLSKEITRANSKLPIAIGPASKPFVLFPTLSPDRIFTRWISFTSISWYDPGALYECDLTFSNGLSYKANISTSSLQTQLSRSLLVYRYYTTLNNQQTKILSHKPIMHIKRDSLERP